MNIGLGLGSYMSSRLGIMTELMLDNSVFVAKNGNDGTGARKNLNKPFLTIGAAKTVAQSGDTIIVYAGIYNELDLLKDGVNYYFYPNAIVETDQPASIIFDDKGLKVVSTITGDVFRLVNGVDADSVIFNISNDDSELTIIANKVLNENIAPSFGFIGCCFSNLGNGTFNIMVDTYQTYNCNYGGGTNTIIVNNIIGGGLDCFGSSFTKIIFNSWVGSVNIPSHGLQIGQTARLVLEGNYVNCIFNNVTAPITGFFQLQGDSTSEIKINFAECNEDNAIFASNIEGDISATLEGIFIHSGTSVRSLTAELGQTNAIELPNNITFRNFQCRVNTATNTISSINDVDVKYLGTYANKNDTNSIKSIVFGANLTVDSDV